VVWEAPKRSVMQVSSGALHRSTCIETGSRNENLACEGERKGVEVWKRQLHFLLEAIIKTPKILKVVFHRRDQRRTAVCEIEGSHDIGKKDTVGGVRQWSKAYKKFDQ